MNISGPERFFDMNTGEQTETWHVGDASIKRSLIPGNEGLQLFRYFGGGSLHDDLKVSVHPSGLFVVIAHPQSDPSLSVQVVYEEQKWDTSSIFRFGHYDFLGPNMFVGYAIHRDTSVSTFVTDTDRYVSLDPKSVSYLRFDSPDQDTWELWDSTNTLQLRLKQVGVAWHVTPAADKSVISLNIHATEVPARAMLERSRALSNNPAEGDLIALADSFAHLYHEFVEFTAETS